MSAQNQDPGFNNNNNSDDELVLEPLEPWMVADINKAIEEVEAEIDSWD